MRPRPGFHALIAFVGVALASTAAAGNPTRIVIAGDHVAVNHATARPPRMGWGQALERFVDVPVIALGASERERATRPGVAPDTSFDEIAAGDLVLVQFVAPPNAPDAAPEAADMAGLRQLIVSARAAGAHPLLVTPVARRQFQADGRALDSHAAISEALRALAAQERIELVELGQRSRDWLEALGPLAAQAWYFHDPATGYVDDEDLDQRGAMSVACLVAADLTAQRLIVHSQLKRDVDCGGAGVSATAAPALVEQAQGLSVLEEPAHGGDGLNLVARFFRDVKNPSVELTRRLLHAGASVGVHALGRDEIWYILGGRGELTLDGKAQEVAAGHAILIRAGSRHSLRQIGEADLELLEIAGAR